MPSAELTDTVGMIASSTWVPSKQETPIRSSSNEERNVARRRLRYKQETIQVRCLESSLSRARGWRLMKHFSFLAARAREFGLSPISRLSVPNPLKSWEHGNEWLLRSR